MQDLESAPEPSAFLHAWQRYGPLGPHPFLAFVNTVDDAGKSRALDGVPDLESLQAWGEAAGLVGGAERQDILLERTGIQEFHRLREASWKLLDSVARGRVPDEGDSAVLRQAIGVAKSRGRLHSSDGHFEWCANEEGHVLIDRLAFAADDLVTSERLRRLKECLRCTALFLDEGRGPGRRFCRPETCGNRAKVERHRQNKRPS